MAEPSPARSSPVTLWQRCAALGVHLLTASGVLLGAGMIAGIANSNYRLAFLLMVVAVTIDAVDGTLARRFQVKRVWPQIDGRTLDDIVDYLNYTFVPLVLLCHAGWLPRPLWGWIAVPLMCSLFGFAHRGAKEEDAGFFRGFPSYWNVVVLYIALGVHRAGPWWVLAILLGLSLLTLLPVRFIYASRPPRWLPLFAGGGVIWAVLLLIMIWNYPRVSAPLLIASLIYPVLYVLLSVCFDVRDRLDRAS
jgi:phosphatidylcholine synthase